MTAVMQGLRCGGLGPRVSRCPGGSRVWNSKACLAQFHSARGWLRCWRQIVPLRIWICNYAPSVSKASRSNGLIFFGVVLERFFEPVSKTVDMCKCGRWCLNTFKHVWCAGRIHFALTGLQHQKCFLQTSMYSKYFKINLFEFACSFLASRSPWMHFMVVRP